VNASTSAHPTLRKVLLATDLSARCDRALDRAVAIAANNNAQLVILHVIEEFQESNLTYGGDPLPSWRAPPNAVERAKIRIREAIQADVGDTLERATVIVREGEPAEVIESVATSEGIELIVTGIAREGLFASRPVVLGRTVEKLLRRMSVPILIVRNRPRASYRHVLVTTDCSEPSAHALQVALSFFPLQTLHLLHAFQVPYAGTVTDPRQYAEGFRQTYTMEVASFLEAMVLPADARRRLVTLVEEGLPAPLVHDYVRDRGADLVVLGTRGRGAVLEALLGSTAKSILFSLACDALLVRAPLRRPPREP
jgi:nucleotide-binding universal stress UspA family protein